MITFQQCTENIPKNWVPGVHWRVECYADTGDLPFPVGTAWVSDYNPHQELVSLDFILVPDHMRRKGIARILMNAIKQRWPKIHVTDAISASGLSFLFAMEPWRVDARKNQMAARRDDRKKRLEEKKRKRKLRK